MKNRMLARVGLGLCMVVATGCADAATSFDGDGAQVEAASQGLSIERHDARSFEGSFVDADTTILFKASAVAADRAELELRVNDKLLSYEALAATSAHDGWFRVDADVSFAAADIASAQTALDALTSLLGSDVTAMSLFESSVPKMAYFIAHQTAGENVPSFQRNEYAAGAPSWRSTADDGLVCIKKTTTLTAWYIKDVVDTRTPSIPVGTYSEAAVVGSNWGKSACGSGDYSCMGRCGGGCGGFGGGWTLDCLEHDVCSQRLCASGGGSDKNCGQEYKHAQSDIFSSCSGN